MHPVEMLRLKLGVSASELARQTGLSYTTIYGIENFRNSGRVHESVADVLAKFFCCQPTDLFRAEDLATQGRPALAKSKHEELVRRDEAGVCQVCWIELSRSGTCDCDT